MQNETERDWENETTEHEINILLGRELYRHCCLLVAARSQGQLSEHPSWAAVSSREPSPGQLGSSRKGQAVGGGRMAGKWARRRDGSPMLNNHSSSARLGEWGSCLNAAFKGIISIPVEKARVISSSSLFNAPLWGLIACYWTFTFSWRTDTITALYANQQKRAGFQHQSDYLRLYLTSLLKAHVPNIWMETVLISPQTKIKEFNMVNDAQDRFICGIGDVLL